MKKDIILVDIDGTISLPGDRLKYLQGKKNWDAFYEACGEDEPNMPVIRTVLALSTCYQIVYCTGRRKGVAEKTVEWLRKYSLWGGNEVLLMRPDGDHRHDTEVKPELVEHIKGRILCILEDRASMVAKWRELGYTCLQVAEGNF